MLTSSHACFQIDWNLLTEGVKGPPSPLLPRRVPLPMTHFASLNAPKLLPGKIPEERSVIFTFRKTFRATHSPEQPLPPNNPFPFNNKIVLWMMYLLLLRFARAKVSRNSRHDEKWHCLKMRDTWSVRKVLK